MGIDVEPPVCDCSKSCASSRFVRKINIELVSPGQLPFEDASFEVVFSKDSIIHIPDDPNWPPMFLEF